MVDGVTGIDRDIRIVDASANVLHTINVKATATEVSQHIKIGGTFGLRLNQPFGVRVDSTGNSALPITGINYIGKVHVFFRYD